MVGGTGALGASLTALVEPDNLAVVALSEDDDKTSVVVVVVVALPTEIVADCCCCFPGVESIDVEPVLWVDGGVEVIDLDLDVAEGGARRSSKVKRSNSPRVIGSVPVPIPVPVLVPVPAAGVCPRLTGLLPLGPAGVPPPG